MLRRHILLLIAIHNQMGTLSLAAPLVRFEKSRLWAGTAFHLLPSFHNHHHPTLHNITTQTVTYRVTLTSASSSVLVHYTDTRPTRNVVCPSGVWFENRPYWTPFIHLAWNPKRIIVQWVGIWNKQKKKKKDKWSFDKKPGHFTKFEKSTRTEFFTLKKRTCPGNTRCIATLTYIIVMTLFALKENVFAH